MTGVEVAEASFLADLAGMLQNPWFGDIWMQPKDESRSFIREWVRGSNIADYLICTAIAAVKPQNVGRVMAWRAGTDRLPPSETGEGRCRGEAGCMCPSPCGACDTPHGAGVTPAAAP